MSTTKKSYPTTNTDMPSVNLPHAVMRGAKPNCAVILSASDKDPRRASTEPVGNHVRLSGHLFVSGSTRVPTRPANANKELALYLSLLDATLTKTPGGREPLRLAPSHALARRTKTVF